MTESVPIIGGLTIGFLGSPHCIGMCGGIAGALSLAAARQRRAPPIVAAHHAAYSLGRVASYATAGALAGAVGFVLGELLGARGGLLLRAAAAMFLVLLGLHVGGWWPGLAWVERNGAWLWARLAPLTARLQPGRSLPAAFAFGMLWGWLPCGLVYSALALAATSGSPLQGALLMAGFGVGTLPATVAAGLLAQRLTWLAQAPASRRLAGVMMIVFGVWTFTGGGGVALVRSTPPGPCHETTE